MAKEMKKEHFPPVIISHGLGTYFLQKVFIFI